MKVIHSVSGWFWFGVRNLFSLVWDMPQTRDSVNATTQRINSETLAIRVNCKLRPRCSAFIFRTSSPLSPIARQSYRRLTKHIVLRQIFFIAIRVTTTTDNIRLEGDFSRRTRLCDFWHIGARRRGGVQVARSRQPIKFIIAVIITYNLLTVEWSELFTIPTGIFIETLWPGWWLESLAVFSQQSHFHTFCKSTEWLIN